MSWRIFFFGSSIPRQIRSSLAFFLIIVGVCDTVHAQTKPSVVASDPAKSVIGADVSRPIAYFLSSDKTRRSVDIEPRQTQFIALVRAKVLHVPASMNPRNIAGASVRQPQTTIRFAARLNIIEFIEGARPERQSVPVFFGDRQIDRNITYPFTPNQLCQTYTVAIYRDVQGSLHLGGFPPSFHDASNGASWLLAFDFGGILGEPVTRGIEEKLKWWNMPGRPAAAALRAAGYSPGSSYDLESLFTRS